MNHEEDLTGTLVLVHPDLKEDPVNKQGQTGMLLYANTEKDEIYVAFGKGEQALYSSDALLVFKQPSEIYQELMKHTRDLPVSEMKALYRIGMLLDSGNSADAKEAMKLAADNPGILGRAMISLQEKLGLDIQHTLSQEQQISASRGR